MSSSEMHSVEQPRFDEFHGGPVERLELQARFDPLIGADHEHREMSVNEGEHGSQQCSTKASVGTTMLD
ncbi:MAG: hypothetical protein R2849_22235 [Thermomicrobiales bacterium]